MIHSLPRNAAIAVWIIAVLSCRGNARDTQPALHKQELAAPSEGTNVSTQNPFAVHGYKVSDVDVSSPVTGCVKLRLLAEDISVGETPRGQLHVDNKCGHAIAILTAPVEVRVRLKSDQRFPAELLTSAVYSTAYIYSESVGLPPSSFRGDGGYEVRGLPRYFRIEAASSAEIPLAGGEKIIQRLPRGSYGISLIVPVAIANGSAAMTESFNLGSSVAQHNAHTTGPPLRFPPSAERLGAVARFSVR